MPGKPPQPHTASRPASLQADVRQGLPRVVIRGLLLAAVAAAVASCSPSPESRWNIVLITLDTIRTDHLGCYGYVRASTPNLDAFAEEAIRFEHASSVINTTLASHASILTGRYPQTLALPRNSFPLGQEFPTLAELLKKEGYATAAFVSASALHSKMGLARGFDHYDQEFGIKEVDQEQRRAEATTSEVLDWLPGHVHEPFFLWVHYFDPHYPYTPPAPFDTLYGAGYEGPADGSMEYLLSIWRGVYAGTRPNESELQRLVDLYDGEIAYLDFWLGPIFRWLNRPEVRSRTLVVVVGDHGESLTEHDYLFNHGRYLYEPSIRVPLLMRFPPADMGNSATVVTQQVQTTDLFPTMLAAAGIQAPSAVEGLDLTSLSLGQDSSIRPPVFAEASRPYEVESKHPRDYQNLHKAQMVQMYPWKLIVTPYLGRLELYNLEDDPLEVKDLAGDEPQRVVDLRRRLDEWRRGATRVAGQPDPENIERLKSLGYTH